LIRSGSWLGCQVLFGKKRTTAPARDFCSGPFSFYFVAFDLEVINEESVSNHQSWQKVGALFVESSPEQINQST